ncbi:MAG: hypothetical protein ACK5LY_00935 [Lachnospirales bacterium]
MSMKSLNNKNYGSISILVIIFMSLVFLFGLYAYNSFKTNDELVNLSYNWFYEENELTNDGYLALYKIESVLLESKELTLQYMYNKEYLNETSETLHQVIHNKLQSDFYSSEMNESAYYNMANDLYLYLVNARLENLVNEVPSLTILKGNDGALVEYINIEMKFKKENFNEYLEAYLEIHNLPYDVSFENVEEVNNIIMTSNSLDLYDLEFFRLNK